MPTTTKPQKRSMKKKAPATAKKSAGASTPKPKEAPARIGKAKEYPRKFIEKFNLSLILEDDENARKNFDEAKQRELEDSVADKGLQQPVWIRLAAKPVKGCTHVLIAGARRTRAAKKVGLLTVPVFDYGTLSDQDAAELADLENCQRADLSDAERALSYAAMVEKHGWQWWDEKNPSKSLAHRFNLGSKSSAYEWARLSKLPKLALQALANGELTSRSVAVKLASIGDPKRLMEALQEAIRNRWTDKEAGEIIAKNYLAELKGVPFALEDEELVPAAGSCVKCPWRSGNQLDLAPEFRRRGDMCTRPNCLDDKFQAAFKRRAKEHEKKGGKVWGAQEAKKNGMRERWSSLASEYVFLDEGSDQWGRAGFNSKGRKLRDVFKAQIESGALKVILAMDHESRTREIGEREAVKKAATALGLMKKERHSSSSGSSEKQKAEQAAKKEGEIVLQLQITEAVEAAIATAGDAEASPWAMLALQKLAQDAGADTCRRIAKRRNFDKANFQLKESYGTWQRDALRKEVGGVLERGRLWEVAAWIAEIVLTPEYLNWQNPGELVDLKDPEEEDEKPWREEAAAGRRRLLAMLKLEPAALFERATAKRKEEIDAKFGWVPFPRLFGAQREAAMTFIDAPGKGRNTLGKLSELDVRFVKGKPADVRFVKRPAPIPDATVNQASNPQKGWFPWARLPESCHAAAVKACPVGEDPETMDYFFEGGKIQETRQGAML
jgi:ParB/RepB/Spo0J family partition protein